MWLWFLHFNGYRIFNFMNIPWHGTAHTRKKSFKYDHHCLAGTGAQALCPSDSHHRIETGETPSLLWSGPWPPPCVCGRWIHWYSHVQIINIYNNTFWHSLLSEEAKHKVVKKKKTWPLRNFIKSPQANKKVPETRRLRQQICAFSHGSGGWQSRIEESIGLAPSEAPLWLAKGCLPLHPHTSPSVCFTVFFPCLFPNLFKCLRQIRLGPIPVAAVYLHPCCKALFPNKVTGWGAGGEDFNTWIWGRHDSVPSSCVDLNTASCILLGRKENKGEARHSPSTAWSSTFTLFLRPSI